MCSLSMEVLNYLKRHYSKEKYLKIIVYHILYQPTVKIGIACLTVVLNAIYSVNFKMQIK